MRLGLALYFLKQQIKKRLILYPAWVLTFHLERQIYSYWIIIGTFNVMTFKAIT